jgi:exosortase/archaeosortase family protein
MRKRLLYALAIVAIPFLEYVVLRFLLHSAFQIRIGWGALLIDADLLLPLPFSFLIGFFGLTREALPPFRLSKKMAFLNACLVAAFLSYSWVFAGSIQQHGGFFHVVWWMAVLSTLFSSGFLFVEPRFYLQNRDRYLLLPCFGVAITLILTKQFYLLFWSGISNFILFTACPLIRIAIDQPVVCAIGEQLGRAGVGSPVLSILTQGLNIHVGPPCSGIDGVLFFLFLSLVFWAFFKEHLTVGLWFITTAFGLPLILLVNSLRLAFIFSFTSWLNKITSSRIGSTVMIHFFHNHLGWFLYLFFGVGYYLGVLALIKRVRLNEKLKSSSRPAFHFFTKFYSSLFRRPPEKLGQS